MGVLTESVYLDIYKAHAAKAVQGMERDGCYWFNEMRPSYGIVVELLRDAGYSVIIFNPPPAFEFAIYLLDNAPSYEELYEIALLRSDMIEQGVPEEKLPVALP